MAELLSVSPPEMTLSIKLETPPGYRFRLWLMSLAIGVAARVAPSQIKMDCELKLASDPDRMIRFEGDTAEGGKIVMCEYPEGYILRHHGEVVWREWDTLGKKRR